MPRAYTTRERDAIRQRLMEIGEQRFARLGLRRTTIDDLVQDAGIGKGSFYQFFDSKEDLFLAIQEAIETRLAETLEAKLAELRRDPPRMVRAFFEAGLAALDEHPFLRQLGDPEITAHLARSVSPQRMERMRRQNVACYRDRFAEWVEQGVVRGIDAETLFGLLAALFVLHQGRDALEGRYEAVTAWLIDSICAHAKRGG